MISTSAKAIEAALPSAVTPGEPILSTERDTAGRVLKPEHATAQLMTALIAAPIHESATRGRDIEKLTSDLLPGCSTGL